MSETRTGRLALSPAVIAAELYPDAREDAERWLGVLDVSTDASERKRALAALDRLPTWDPVGKTFSTEGGPGLEEPAQPKPAEPSIRFLWEAATAASEELDRYHAGDFSRYVPTGIPALDRKLGGGMRRGTFSLLGAPTGAGKSTILQLIASSAAAMGGALLVSPEMSIEELAERDIIRRSLAPKWLRNPWTHHPQREVALTAHMQAETDMRNERLPLLVLDQPAVTMEGVERAAREAKRRLPNLALIAIDYAQEVADTDPKAPRYLTVGAVAQKSVEIARTLDVAVLVASQVNTIKNPKGPTEYSFRESQILEHKAYNVWQFVVEWGSDADGQREVSSATIRAPKSRGGRVFELPVFFDPAVYHVGEKPDRTLTTWNGEIE